MLHEYYEERDITVYWDPDNNWIYADWRNIPSTGTVKEGCAAILKLLQSKRASNMVNNNANVTGPWSGASQWVAKVWFPQMIEAGLKKFAWIQSPHSILSQISAETSEAKDEGDVIRLFKDRESAETWLRSR